VQISISPHLPQHAGESFGQLAVARSCDPFDAVCDYLIEDKGATRVLITSIAEEDSAFAFGSRRLRRQLCRRLRGH
jgi:N-acyl-D-amino-acid deacylase